MKTRASSPTRSVRTLALVTTERKAAAEHRRQTRCAAPLPWPTSGPERGDALRSVMRRHSLSYVTTAQAIGVSVSTLSTWTNGSVDVVEQTRAGNVTGLLTLLRRLEPGWRSEDVWRTFGVPEGLRDVWVLPDTAAAPSVVRVERLGGEVMSMVPLEVQVMAGEGSGGLVLYRNGEDWLCATSRVIPPPGWTPLGRIVSMMPLA